MAEEVAVVKKPIVYKPILQMPGGKRQLMPELLKRLPDPMPDLYAELFLGGGALFFELRSRGELNLWNEVQRAARVIFLNRTGFNGLYRVNRAGKINVPWGKDTSSSYATAESLETASQALQNTTILHGPFSKYCFYELERSRFIYLDPPYPGGFTAYTKEGFSDADSANLFEWTATRAFDGKIMMSNADHPVVHELFEKHLAPVGFKLERITARRNINRDGAGRGPVGEVIIRNY